MASNRRDFAREPISLRDAVDRLVRDNIVRPAADLVTQMSRSLPLDVADTEENFVVEASLPGLTADEVAITVQGDTLTIRGEPRHLEDTTDRTWLLRERRTSIVERSIQLPARVDLERAEARVENGVLTLTLPKAEQAEPTRIQVAGASTSNAGSSTDQARSAQAQPTFPGEQHRITPTGADEEHKDAVTEASMESFPASDPPSWGSRST